MTIVNVSIPAIAGSLGVSPTEGTWAISSYLLAAAVVQPLAGWIGRRFGEVRTFVVSNLLFIVFSVLCGLATSMPMLIAARLMQGLVSGPMMSVAQALLLRNYPVHLRGLALGLWAMVVIVAPVVGPVLGGWITDNYSWPWLFYINVPIGLAAAGISWCLLRHRESHAREGARRRRRPGAAGDRRRRAAVHARQRQREGLVPLHGDRDRRASSRVVALTFLIPWELTDKHPIVDLHLFQRRNFRVGTHLASPWPTSRSPASTSSSRCGCRRRWATPAPGRALRWRPIGIVALVIAPVLGRNLHRINLRLAPTIAFCILGVCAVLVRAADRTGLVRAAGNAALHHGLRPGAVLPAAEPDHHGGRLARRTGLGRRTVELRPHAFAAASPPPSACSSGPTVPNTTTPGSTEHITPDSAAWADYQAQLAQQGITGDAALVRTARR